jgi:hypothetical protein
MSLFMCRVVIAVQVWRYFERLRSESVPLRAVWALEQERRVCWRTEYCRIARRLYPVCTRMSLFIRC